METLERKNRRITNNTPVCYDTRPWANDGIGAHRNQETALCFDHEIYTINEIQIQSYKSTADKCDIMHCFLSQRSLCS